MHAKYLLLLFTSIISTTVVSSESTETIEVRYTRDILSVHNEFTRNNVIIDPEDINSLNRTVADIIAPAIGITYSGQGGLLQSYNIRGLSRARIKTLVNGVPIITDRRAGNSLSFIPPEFINQATILKGPASSLYGSNALGGVVSVSTHNDNQSRIVSHYQPINGSVNFAGNYAANHFSVAAAHRDEDNSRSASKDHSFEDLNSQYTQNYLSVNTQFSWRNLTIEASSIVSHGSDIGKSSREFPDNKISIYPKDNHWLNQVAVSYQNQWRFNLYHHTQNWQSDTTRLNVDGSANRQNISDYQSQTFGGYGAYLIGDMQIGVEWLTRNNIKIKERELSTDNQLNWRQQLVDASENNGAVFVQKYWRKGHFNLTAGLRYDWFSAENSINALENEQSSNKVNDHFLSYSLNNHFQLSDSTQLSFELANSFRFPTVSELFFSGDTPRGDIQGNYQLKPERSAAIEIGIRHQVNDNITLEFNSYHYAIDDYIERFSINDELKSYRNNQQAKIRGIELMANWQWSQAVSGSLGYQYQNAKDDDGNTVDDSLPEALKFSVNWWLDVGLSEQLLFNNHLEYQFSQSNYGPNEKPQDAHLVWHSQLQYELNNHHLLSLGMTNLTNSAYRASADEQAPFQPERAINFTWQWLFN